jgi:AraC family transcriptional regulator of adaptative response / DNA-3-methyladenine glycosylase II
MPAGRRRALGALSAAVADGGLTIDPGADPAELDAALQTIDGIGPWTAAYVTMRAVGDPDAFLPTDLGVRRALQQLGLPDDPAGATARAAAWRPWRAYALCHLWSVPIGERTAKTVRAARRGTRKEEEDAA